MNFQLSSPITISSLVNILLWLVLAYLSGSIPFSLLLTRKLTSHDIRKYGDGNPGAYNAWQVGGWPVGITAILLDVGKGTLPVYLAQKIGGISGWALLPIAIAPILAHAFSPLLHFRKAKAVAATLGVWFALTGLRGIIAFAVMAVIAMAWQEEHAWVVIAGMAGIAVYCLFFIKSPWLVATALVNLTLLCITHHKDLRLPIRLHYRVGEYLVHRRNSL